MTSTIWFYNLIETYSVIFSIITDLVFDVFQAIIRKQIDLIIDLSIGGDMSDKELIQVLPFEDLLVKKESPASGSVEQLIQINQDRELAELKYSANCIDLPVENSISAYLSKRENYHTKLAHKKDLQQFCEHLRGNHVFTLGHLGSKPAHEIRALCEGWLDSLLMDGFSKITVQRKKGTVRAFFRYLNQELPQLIKSMPVLDSDKHREFYSKARTEAFSYDEWRLFQSVIRDNPRTYSLYVLTNTAMLLGGRRIGEVLKLVWADIDEFGNRVSVIPSKKKSDRTRHILPLSPQLKSLLLEYKSTFKKKPKNNDKVFPDATQQRVDSKMRYYAKKAGLTKKISFHSIRTSFVTWANEQGHSQSEILNATLHASSAMIRYYDQTDPLAVNSIHKLMP